MTDEAIVQIACRLQMPGVRLMIRAEFAGIRSRLLRLVMMERQHQRHRQNDR